MLRSKRIRRHRKSFRERRAHAVRPAASLRRGNDRGEAGRATGWRRLPWPSLRAHNTRDRDRCRPTAVPLAMRSAASIHAREPPPAPAVWISSMGTRTGNPLTWPSMVVGGSRLASSRATSVDVPPMSKVSSRSMPARRAMLSAPVTPPAGPDKMVRTGSRAAAGAERMPPEDCMMLSCAPRRLRLRCRPPI